MKKNYTILPVLTLCLLVTAIMFIFAESAFASTSAGMPWESALQTLQRSITGPVAMAISLIAIIAAGAALIFGGDMTGFMRTTVYIVLVLGIIVSASGLLGSLYTTSAVLPVTGLLI